MELTDEAEHSRWHAKKSSDSSREGLVYGVIGFGEVDEAHQQRGILPRQLLQASHHKHHVDRRALGSRAPLLLRQHAFPCAVDAEAARDDLEEYFAGVRHEGDTTIVCTLRLIFCFVQHLDRCIFPLLRHASPHPHSDDDIEQVYQDVRISVGQDLQKFRQEANRPNRLTVRHRPDRFIHRVPRRYVV